VTYGPAGQLGLLIKDYHQHGAISADEIYSTIVYRMSRWSWFDVNRSTFEEDNARKRFYIFVPSDLDL